MMPAHAVQESRDFRRPWLDRDAMVTTGEFTTSTLSSALWRREERSVKQENLKNLLGDEAVDPGNQPSVSHLGRQRFAHVRARQLLQLEASLLLWHALYSMSNEMDKQSRLRQTTCFRMRPVCFWIGNSNMLNMK